MLESYLAWLHFFVLSQDYSSKNVEGTRKYFVSKRVIPFQMSWHWKWTIFIISFFWVFSLQMSLATSWRTNLFCFRIDLLLLGLHGPGNDSLAQRFPSPVPVAGNCLQTDSSRSPRSPALRPLTPMTEGARQGFAGSVVWCVCVCFGVAIKDLDSKRNVKSTCWHIYTSHSLPFQLRLHSLSASTPVNFLIHIRISVLPHEYSKLKNENCMSESV